MRWVVLASILAVEFCLVLLLVQVLARRFWVWIRWPIWIVLLLATLIPFAAACDWVQRNSSHITSGDWSSDRDLFNLHAPYSSFRLLLLAPLAAIPLLLFVIGLASLLRWRLEGLQFVVWRISWRSSLRVLAYCLGLLIVVLAANDWLVSYRIRKMDDEARSLATKTAPPPCSDDENAAPTIDEVGALSGLSQKHLPDPRDNINLLRSEAWTDYFRSNREHAERIRQASSRPRCRFDIDWSDPNPIAQYPDVGHVQDCLRLLYDEGRRALLDGDLELGWKDAMALRRMAELLNEDPRHNSQLLSSVAEGVACNVIEHLVYLHQPTSAEVAQLARPDFEFGIRLTAVSDRDRAERYRMVPMAYFGLVVDPKDYKVPGFRFLHAAVLARDRLLFANDDLRALPIIFDEIRIRCAAPYGQPAGTRDALWYLEYKSGGARITQSIHVDSFVAAIIRADMQRRLVDFALQVSQRGLVTEALEKGPDTAIPATERPIDLFDRMPVKICVADGGLIIYSVDRDGKDDGGAEDVPRSPRRDMTFCFGEAYKTRRLLPKKEVTAKGID